MAKLSTVSEPKFNLELTLAEAAAIQAVVGHTAGDAKELTTLYHTLSANKEIVNYADVNFKFSYSKFAGEAPQLNRKD